MKFACKNHLRELTIDLCRYRIVFIIAVSELLCLFLIIFQTCAVNIFEYKTKRIRLMTIHIFYGINRQASVSTMAEPTKQDKHYKCGQHLSYVTRDSVPFLKCKNFILQNTNVTTISILIPDVLCSMPWRRWRKLLRGRYGQPVLLLLVSPRSPHGQGSSSSVSFRK